MFIRVIRGKYFPVTLILNLYIACVAGSSSYDYIFLGAGCASLSIVMRMTDCQELRGKKILLIDKAPKNKNDRTWCFWEKENGYFEDIVYKKWSKLLFKSGDLSIPLDIDPYRYKMVRGIDFYKHCFSKIALHPNIEVKYGQLEFHHNVIKIDSEILPTENAILFNSIYNAEEIQKNKIYLQQHFKGWVIETPGNFFDSEQGTLMDFRVDQDQGTTFVYVLPLSSNKALVEYTLFTEKLLPPGEYNIRLKKYIEDFLRPGEYRIAEEEFGVIPMTNAKFRTYENGMYNIGTAGGQTKASTGYTFQFIQKQSQQIVKDIVANGTPSKAPATKKRFHFYDSTLLHILGKNKLEGKDVFTRLFQKNKASAVFKFLDNETNLKEELQIIGSLPTKEFLFAGAKEFLKML